MHRLSVSSLFDADWYGRQYPDVSADDLLEHYLTTGWREGRDPGPLFDSDWYLAVYPAAEHSGENPLLHFLAHGRDEVLQPNPIFDAGWYRTQNGIPRGWDPFTHYVLRGRGIGLKPSPAVAASALPRPVPACRPQPTVTVVIPSDDDFVHTDRCLRALSATEAFGWAQMVVVVDRESLHPWQRLTPWARMVTCIPGAIDSEYLLLLRPDAEPAPGFLHALVAAHRSTRHHGTVAVFPRTHPTLVAPSGTCSWDALTTLGLPAQATLISAADWVELADRLDPDDAVRSAADCVDALILASDSHVLSHRPMAIALRIKQELRRWDPESMARLVVLVAQADRRVAVAAAVAWLHLAECDAVEAITALARWRVLLAELPEDIRASLPRLIRRRDQLVADIIHESMLQPAASERAGRAVAAGDVTAAITNLTCYPDSYPAAVAVMALARESRRVPTATLPPIPREIVQGWFDTPMPAEVAAVARSWPQHHQGWRYRFFDTDSAAAWILEHLGSEAAQVFRSTTPVGKSNLLRYAYLAEVGGVWSDTDDRCLASIEPLIDDNPFVIVKESIGAIADNFIAVTPRHPVLIATRDEAFGNVRDGFGESQWLANGPGLFTRKVAAWAARLIGTEAGDYLMMNGAQISRYISMHQQTQYKETALAWDVPTEPIALELEDVQPLSRRQRELQRMNSLVEQRHTDHQQDPGDQHGVVALHPLLDPVQHRVQSGSDE